MTYIKLITSFVEICKVDYFELIFTKSIYKTIFLLRVFQLQQTCCIALSCISQPQLIRVVFDEAKRIDHGEKGSMSFYSSL
jgi:hypothetical protein